MDKRLHFIQGAYTQNFGTCDLNAIQQFLWNLQPTVNLCSHFSFVEGKQNLTKADQNFRTVIAS